MMNVELVDLLSELILLNGLSARNGQRETPLEVLHLVHVAEKQTLEERRKRWILTKDTVNYPVH